VLPISSACAWRASLPTRVRSASGIQISDEAKRARVEKARATRAARAGVPAGGDEMGASPALEAIADAHAMPAGAGVPEVADVSQASEAHEPAMAAVTEAPSAPAPARRSRKKAATAY
jgi:hypothetical protein